MSTDYEWRRNMEEPNKLRAKSRRQIPASDATPLVIRLASFDPNESSVGRFILSNVADSEELSRILESFARTPPPEARASSGTRLDVLEEEVQDLKQRIDFIESANKAVYLQSNWFEIVAEVTSLFSPLNYVKEIYAKKDDGLCDLIFVLDSESPPSAEEEVLTRTFLLEKRFPKVDFDYITARHGEIDDSDLAKRLLLYSRR